MDNVNGTTEKTTCKGPHYNKEKRHDWFMRIVANDPEATAEYKAMLKAAFNPKYVVYGNKVFWEDVDKAIDKKLKEYLFER